MADKNSVWTTMRGLVICMSVVLLANSCLAGKVLGVFPMVSKSHWAVGSAIVKVLAEAGHEASVLITQQIISSPSDLKNKS